jgi:hypothetical protein
LVVFLFNFFFRDWEDHTDAFDGFSITHLVEFSC